MTPEPSNEYQKLVEAVAEAVARVVDARSSDIYWAVERGRNYDPDINAEIAAAALSALKLPGDDGWQDIADVPRDMTWVLCWGPDGHGIAKFCPNPIWSEYPDYTHWRPLPTPPAGVSDNF